ncbi:MAG: hypothetical protein K0R82_2680, partial [Flavipsychrobacter sp.]|nr:hypothetical protein [Flavipsychrobacter sp.]
MKYFIAPVACIFLFTQCSRDTINVQPTGGYDTLGIHWMTIERTNITYYFQGTGASGASLYTDMHEEAYTKLDEVFKAKMPQKLRFFVWTDWDLARQLVGPLGFAVPSECITHVAASQTLGHEMTHSLAYWAAGIPPTTQNRFINEGLAVAFDLRETDRIDEAKEAISGQNISSVADVWSGSAQIDDEALYLLGGAFMDYLYKQSQPDQFFTLIKNQTIEDAESIYGKERLHALIA